MWDLRDWRSGVCVLMDGVTGLHSPRIDKFRSESRSVPGHRRRGWRTTGRDVFWPVFVYGDGSDAWRDVYGRFFATIHPDREGVWEVTAGDSSRRLRLTGVFDDEYQFGLDPLQHGWARFPVSLEPAQPYWEGDPVTTGEFGVPDPVDFIDEEVGAPDFHLSTSSTFASATISNPGDVESWLVWTVRGPLTGVELGVGGVTAPVPFDLLDGQTLRIDTDPRNVTATLNGIDATAELGLIEFGPVPPGEDVDLSITATGSGTVQGQLIPLYFRAF